MSNEPLHYALDLPTFQTLLTLRELYLWLQRMTNHSPFSKYFLAIVPSLDLLSSHHQHSLRSFRHLLLVCHWHLFRPLLDKTLPSSLEASPNAHPLSPSFQGSHSTAWRRAGAFLLIIFTPSSVRYPSLPHQHASDFPFFHQLAWAWGWDQQLAEAWPEHPQQKPQCSHPHTTGDALPGPSRSSCFGSYLLNNPAWKPELWNKNEHREECQPFISLDRSQHANVQTSYLYWGKWKEFHLKFPVSFLNFTRYQSPAKQKVYLPAPALGCVSLWLLFLCPYSRPVWWRSLTLPSFPHRSPPSSPLGADEYKTLSLNRRKFTV